jgi:hypothetical protein
MPNHIYSTIDIVCKENQVEEIKNLFRSEEADERGNKAPFDFNRFIPTPPEVDQGPVSFSDKEKNPLNWYDWNRENWGTKWNAYSQREPEVFKGSNTVDMINEDNPDTTSVTFVLRFYFETAWSPINDTILPVISEKLPDNKIVYTALDEGGNFVVRYKYINEDVIQLCDTGEVSQKTFDEYYDFLNSEGDVFNEVVSC